MMQFVLHGRWLILLLLAPSECYGKTPTPARAHLKSSSSCLLASAAPTGRLPGAAAPRSYSSRPSLIAASAPSGFAGKPSGLGGWLLKYRSLMLLICLVIHKCATDGLTRYTRMQGTYSGATVAVMSEVVKFPLIATAIASMGGGPSQVVPIFREAFSKKLFANAWISLCYTFNNLLYFDALSAISAVAYQVLSQSKTLFTAGLMYVIVGKRLIARQIAAIALLIAGALLVQAQEFARSTAAGAASAVSSSTIWWGVGLTIFSSFISALPNVQYEKVLKTEGENQWVNNVQVTVWIMLWIYLASWLPTLKGLAAAAVGRGAAPLGAFGGLARPSLDGLARSVAEAPGAFRAAFEGFTLPVWGVVLMKALNGILIPATFKYADNILYAYAKPSSIVVMTVISCMITGTLPSLPMLLGVSAVVGSIVLYSSKPKPKAA